MNEEIKRLYTEEKYTLRRIGKIIGKDHHFVKRRLQEMGIEITQKDRKHEPFTEEHKRKISEKAKGRVGTWKGKKCQLNPITKICSLIFNGMLI